MYGKQGDLHWRMHNLLQVASVVWYDKKPIFVANYFSKPYCSRPRPEHVTVNQFMDISSIEVVTSSIHKGYQTYMRGVDVTDQLRGTYFSQVKNSKNGAMDFYFILFDTTMVNA